MTKRFPISVFTISLLLSFGFLSTAIKPQSTIDDLTFKSISSLKVQDGDIIFQTSGSGQSRAIQLATNSEYSHCGIIFIENEKAFVLEAVQPVKRTTLEEWIARGDGQNYVTKRLVNSDKLLTSEVLQKMKSIGNYFVGKNYDLLFNWSDDQIYCSELVWKIYKRGAGIEVGKLQQLNEFDLSSEIVKRKLTERYGNKIPMDETVISPASIFDSELLMMVESN